MKWFLFLLITLLIAISGLSEIILTEELSLPGIEGMEAIEIETYDFDNDGADEYYVLYKDSDYYSSFAYRCYGSEGNILCTFGHSLINNLIYHESDLIFTDEQILVVLNAYSCLNDEKNFRTEIYDFESGNLLGVNFNMSIHECWNNCFEFNNIGYVASLIVSDIPIPDNDFGNFNRHMAVLLYELEGFTLLDRIDYFIGFNGTDDEGTTMFTIEIDLLSAGAEYLQDDFFIYLGIEQHNYIWDHVVFDHDYLPTLYIYSFDGSEINEELAINEAGDKVIVYENSLISLGIRDSSVMSQELGSYNSMRCGVLSHMEYDDSFSINILEKYLGRHEGCWEYDIHNYYSYPINFQLDKLSGYDDAFLYSFSTKDGPVDCAVDTTSLLLYETGTSQTIFETIEPGDWVGYYRMPVINEINEKFLILFPQNAAQTNKVISPETGIILFESIPEFCFDGVFEYAENEYHVWRYENEAVHLYSAATTIGIQKSSSIASKSSLHISNHPNPFNPTTTICFELKKPETVSLEIFNIRGQLVRTFAEEEQFEAGHHSLVWDGKDSQGNEASSGVYFYRLKTREEIVTKKMLLIK